MVLNKPRSILIITSSGGGGHLQAAKTKAREESESTPGAKIITVDIQLDWMGAKLGRFFTSLWNNAQAEGNVAKQHRLLSCQGLLEKIFWLPIFLKAFFLIYTLRIERIIDTQPTFTSAIVKASKVTAHLQKRSLSIEKVITELPTDQCCHFFAPIKKLSKRDRHMIRLVATTPLVSPSQTTALFWQQECGLPEEAIDYSDLPLRPSFKKYQDLKNAHEPIPLSIKIHSQEERSLIEETIRAGSIPFLYRDEQIALSLNPDHKIYTLMLGSIPAEKTTLSYIHQFVKTIQDLGTESGNFLLFVFCNHHKVGSHSLLKKVATYVKTAKHYPKNLTIIPMTFQDDSVIAPLFFRSDATFTRSGGLTSMELLSVARGQICIHSESKDGYHLERGMPRWEFGNAAYLKEKRGAKILSIACFKNFCRPLLQKNFFSAPETQACQESMGLDLIR